MSPSSTSNFPVSLTIFSTSQGRNIGKYISNGRSKPNYVDSQLQMLQYYQAPPSNLLGEKKKKNHCASLLIYNRQIFDVIT